MKNKLAGKEEKNIFYFFCVISHFDNKKNGSMLPNCHKCLSKLRCYAQNSMDKF